MRYDAPPRSQLRLCSGYCAPRSRVLHTHAQVRSLIGQPEIGLRDELHALPNPRCRLNRLFEMDDMRVPIALHQIPHEPALDRTRISRLPSLKGVEYRE